MAYLEGFEPPAFWSVARRSIQLSYRYCFISETFIRYNRFGEIQVENTFFQQCGVSLKNGMIVCCWMGLWDVWDEWDLWL